MSEVAAVILDALLAREDLSSLKSVRSRDGTETGTVISTTRRCQLDGCGGIRIGVRWSDGHRTYPCSRGMTEVGTDTWQIL